jgi:hypothetical protein
LRIATAVAGLGALFLLTSYLTGSGIVDDAYIFLRYARNIWGGYGAVFNPGEAVEGYTSPGWLAILTFLWPIPIPAPQLAVAASAALAFVVVLFIAHRSGANHVAALIGAAFLASNPAFVYWAWSGMDSALFTLLITVTLVSFEARLERQASLVVVGIWFALSALARLDALWFAPLFVLLILRRYRSRSVSALLEIAVPVALVIGTHFLWRHSYYGVWLPNTYYAKVGVPLASKLSSGGTYLLRAIVACLPLVALLGLGIRMYGLERLKASVFVCAIVWWLTYVVSVGGDHFALQRFIVPALALCAVVGARLAAAAMVSTRRKRAAAAAALMLASNGFMLLTPEIRIARAEVVDARTWERIGNWCADNLPPGSFATLVVGAIPYFCDRETIDVVGLVDAHIGREGAIFPEAAVGHQKFDTEYVLMRAPRYILFPTLAQTPEPLFARVEDRFMLPRRTWSPFIDLVTNQRTLATYQYRAQRLEDGAWVEFLERR